MEGEWKSHVSKLNSRRFLVGQLEIVDLVLVSYEGFELILNKHNPILEHIPDNDIGKLVSMRLIRRS